LDIYQSVDIFAHVFLIPNLKKPENEKSICNLRYCLDLAAVVVLLLKQQLILLATVHTAAVAVDSTAVAADTTHVDSAAK
jgi:hypothetical protein